jgi:proline dehydrogenase
LLSVGLHYNEGRRIGLVSRAALLFLSRQSWLRRWAEHSPVAAKAVKRFVAGPHLDDAILVCKQLAGEGTLATLDHLGENVATPEQAGASLAAALEAIARLDAERIGQATVSIKLTQFGLDLSESGCLDRVSTLVEAARRSDRRIEIDMESTAYTAKTLDIVRELHRRFGNVRAVIQAYLFRSETDIESLSQSGISVRLCKGAYLEPSEVAFAEKADVDRNYRLLMARLLEAGANPALATHDESMIGEAVRLVESLKIGPERFEFQMLYGIRRDLQRDLVRRGFRVRLYVPYGEAWYPYFMRRLAERPANVKFLLENLGRS